MTTRYIAADRLLGRARWEAIAFFGLGLLHFGYVFLVATPLIHADEAACLLKGAALVGYSTQGANECGVGFGLLLAPLFAAFAEPTTIYRLCLIVNAALATLTVVLVYKIILAWREPAIDWRAALVASSVMALYPAFFAYTTSAQPEVLLALIFVVIAYAALRTLKGTGPDWGLLTIWATSTGAIVVVHQRGVAVVLPSIILAVLALARERRYPAIAAWLGIVAAVVVCGFALDRYAQSQLTLPAPAMLSGPKLTNYQTIVAKLARLFESPERFRELFGELLLTLSGQTAYLVVATFGVIILAVIALSREATSDGSFATRAFSAFALATLVFNVVMSSFFLLSGTRIDHAIYGRYNEVILPLFLAIGLTAIDRSTKRFMLSAFVIALPVLVFVVMTAALGRNPTNMHNVMSIYWLIEKIETRQFVWVLGFAVFVVAIFAVVRCPRWLVVAIGGFFALQTADVGANFLHPSSNGRALQRQIADYLRRHTTEGTCITINRVAESSEWAHWNYKYFLLGYPVRETTTIVPEELCSPWVISADPNFAAAFPHAIMILRETEQPEQLWYLGEPTRSRRYGPAA